MAHFRFPSTRLLAFLVALSALLVGLPSTAYAVNNATVSGTITAPGDASTESSVDLYRWVNGAFVLERSADVVDSPNNTYSFGALVWGRYYVVASPSDDDNFAPSYSAGVTTKPVAQNDPGTFQIAADVTSVRNIVLRAWGNGTAAGVISSAAGPLPDATVSLFRLTGSPGSFSNSEWVDDVTTGVNGAFEFPAFKQDGSFYTVSAYYVDPGNRRYLGGGTNVLQAANWSHTSSVTAKNISLNVFQLIGEVTGGNRQIADTTVVAFRWSGSAWVEAGTSGLDGGGNYTIYLPTGTYSLLTSWFDGPDYQATYLDGSDLPPAGPAGPAVLELNDNLTRNIALTSLGAAPTPTVEPTIAGTGRTGTNLTVTPGTWTNSPTFTYQWYRFASPIPGATGATYEVVNADAGEQISAEVTAKAPGRLTGVAYSNTIDGVGVFETAMEPSITGTGAFGMNLTLDPGTWSDTPTLTRQWLRDGTPISGATGLTYSPAITDLGEPISARVTATRSAFDTAIVVTDAIIITPGSLASSTAPSITGGSGVGGTLTLSPGIWATNPSLSFQWLSDGVEIVGETNLTYSPTMTDLEAEISAEVTAAQDGYYDAVEGTNSVTIAPGALIATIAPSLSGAAKVGSTLSLNGGAWPQNPVLTYQWLRNGAPIPGEDSTTYAVKISDAGQRIQARVSAASPGYAGTAVTSNVTVAKLTSTTTGVLAKNKIKARKRAKYTVTVKVLGINGPAGAITIYDKAKVIKRLNLTAANAGRVTVKLPKLKQGKHKIKAVYAGGTTILASTSATAKLKVI